jgi:hypothetical protein
VWKAGTLVRIVLGNSLIVSLNAGFSPAEVGQILKIVDENFDFLLEQWQEIRR